MKGKRIMNRLLAVGIFIGSVVSFDHEAAAGVPAPAQALEKCDTMVNESPQDLPGYRCYWENFRKAPDAARQRFEAALLKQPANPAAQLYLAFTEWDQGRMERVETLLRGAVSGFGSQSSAEGHVLASIGLAKLFNTQRRQAETLLAMEEASKVAERSGDSMLAARVQWAWATKAYFDNDYSRAYVYYKQAEATVFPKGPSDVQIGVLFGLGSIAWATGKYREGMGYYSRGAELKRQMGDVYGEAAQLANVAMMAGRLQANDEVGIDEVRSLLSHALEVALAGNNRSAEASVRRLSAQDHSLDLPTRIDHAEKTLGISSDLHDETNHCSDLRLLASLKCDLDPAHRDDYLRLYDEAIRRARAIGDRRQTALGLITRGGQISNGPRKEQGIEDVLAGLDEIEAMRDLQRDELVRARFFSEWAFVYYRVAGMLLDLAGENPPAEKLQRPFEVGERLRARVLLDSLDAAGSTPAVLVKGPQELKRDALLEKLAQVQRRLTSPTLTPVERAAALEELEHQEVEELAIREEIARVDPRFAALHRPRFSTIDDVRSALTGDQAMLAFQLSTRRRDEKHWYYNGGSWLYVITNKSARVIPLADSDELENAVRIYLGLLERRDKVEPEIASRLYDQLLSRALSGLPPEVTRLILIPDGALHRLPFDALRPVRGGAPLASRFEITLAPSATTWLHWHGSSTHAPIPVLALADPVLSETFQPASMRGGAPWWEGLRLGSLPYARSEAARLVARLGGGSRLLAGREATESHLKESDLNQFTILHFAAHAVVDDRHPERSAVVLSPGTDKEDGLLQMREVVGLDLKGQVVVLAACNSASGELVGGEGFLGLARAFFQAGARTVIGSLWPLRDQEASNLIDGFYGHLDEGKTVAGAMAAARRDRIRAGDAPAAWAGLQVFGNGDLVPRPVASLP